MTIYTTRRLFGKLILQELTDRGWRDAKEAPTEPFEIYVKPKPKPPITARPEGMTGPAQATGHGVDMPAGRPKV